MECECEWNSITGGMSSWSKSVSSEREDLFFVHFKENKEGDVSISKNMQLAFPETINSAWIRIRRNADLNCGMVGLLLHPFFDRMQEKSNSKWSWHNLYVSKYKNGSFTKVRSSIASFFTLVAAMMKPWTNVLLLVFISGTPSVVFKLERYATEESIMPHHSFASFSRSGFLNPPLEFNMAWH